MDDVFNEMDDVLEAMSSLEAYLRALRFEYFKEGNKKALDKN